MDVSFIMASRCQNAFNGFHGFFLVSSSTYQCGFKPCSIHFCLQYIHGLFWFDPVESVPNQGSPRWFCETETSSKTQRQNHVTSLTYNINPGGSSQVSSFRIRNWRRKKKNLCQNNNLEHSKVFPLVFFWLGKTTGFSKMFYKFQYGFNPTSQPNCSTWKAGWTRKLATAPMAGSLRLEEVPFQRQSMIVLQSLERSQWANIWPQWFSWQKQKHRSKSSLMVPISSSKQQGWDMFHVADCMLGTLESRLFKSSPKQHISAFQYQQDHVTVTTKKSQETVQWALAHANDLLHFWTAWDWKGSTSVAAVHHTNIWNGRVCCTSSCKGTW